MGGVPVIKALFDRYLPWPPARVGLAIIAIFLAGYSTGQATYHLGI